MSMILAVFGATGQQGGSVINYVLNDPELSQKYKIRAITRDANTEKAKQLRVEVVQGDVLNRASLKTALAGAHTVFAMTTPSFDPNGLEIEYNNGKRIVDVALKKVLSISSLVLSHQLERSLAVSTLRSPPLMPRRKPSSIFEALRSRALSIHQAILWRTFKPRPS